MAPAHQRWHSAFAKTAASLLAHRYFVQVFWRECRRRPATDCSRGSRLGRDGFLDWRKTRRLLARFRGWSDLSQPLRRISARANRHASAASQCVYYRRDLLLLVWFSTPE